MTQQNFITVTPKAIRWLTDLLGQASDSLKQNRDYSIAYACSVFFKIG